MKKKIALLVSLIAVMILSLVACVQKEPEDIHTFIEHSAVEATCENGGNEKYYTCSHCDLIFNAEKEEISAIPTVGAKGHDYVSNPEVPATCATSGTISHYTCSRCDLLFDLNKEQIDSVEIEIDPTNHLSTPALTLVNAPSKRNYVVGETFDKNGMQIAYGCAECEGEILDNQFLTVAYQTENATAFAMGDTKVVVTYGDLSIEIEISVGKKQAVISGVEESYQTVCATAPVIQASVNYSELNIVIEYYDAENNLIDAKDFIANGEYTARVYVEDTADVAGAEVVTAITVAHEKAWRKNVDDNDKMEFVCACGYGDGVYATNNVIAWFDGRKDGANLAYDFSDLVVGATTVTLDSVKKVDGDETVDLVNSVIDGTQIQFAKDDFNVTEWTPYELPLKVALTVDGSSIDLYFYAKYVDGVIKTAEDLSVIGYVDEIITGYYVLANDIDASSFVVNTNPCFQIEGGFQGIFNGQGYTVSNLNLTSGCGLFGGIGARAQIINVNFTNVNVQYEYALAFAIRNASFKNVNIEISKDSKIFKVFYTANATEFDNVTVKTCVEDTPFLIDENSSNQIPDSVTIEYYDYHTVTFNSNGGTQIDDVLVTDGRLLTAPVIPEKGEVEDVYYEFDGWFVGEDKYDFTAPVVEDLSLEAKWVETQIGPYGKPVLNARNQTLTRWDYGNEITVANSTDSFYGDVMVMSVSDCVEQGFTHTAISTGDFVKIYFFVFNPCANDIRFNVHSAKTWGAKEIMIPAKAWTRIEIESTYFNETVDGIPVGKVNFIVQDPNAVSVAGEWKITSFFGVKEGEEIPEIVNPILVDASCQTLVKWDYGNELTVANSTDDTYGDVFVVTIGAIAEQSITHAPVSVGDFDKVSFNVYNPCEGKMRLTIHGGYDDGWGLKTIELDGQSWTKVEVEVSAFEVATPGQIFLMIQDPDGVSIAGEWKFTSFIGEYINPILVDASCQTLTRWDYGNEITVVNSTDDTYGDVFVVTIGAIGEQSITHAPVSVGNFDKVSFFVFNPCEGTMRLTIHGGYDDGWGLKTIELDGQSWTKVEVEVSAFEVATPGQIFLMIQDPYGVSIAGEWKITSFTGVKA
ncbi:MAG: InlB B-repeat-containing protein [Clostridia bacterium]|nr:InlB B-repeat-containing protein [Clostridia bacterium]